MDGFVILMLLGTLAFVLEAFSVTLGTFSPKWWALGVACWLAAQVVT